MSAPAQTSPASGPAPGRTLAAWWQAAPLTAVFVLFFLIPLALILMVSFWDFNEYQREYAETEAELNKKEVSK